MIRPATIIVGLSGFLLLQLVSSAQTSVSPIELCRLTDFSLEGDKFDKNWKERVALEFDIVNRATLKSLRAGLRDPNLYVRAMAARALGIRGDRESAEALADLVRSEPEYLVRIRAVEALGLLKLHPEVVASAKKDKSGAVRWAADLSADMIRQDVDYASQVRRAFSEGITHEEMGRAAVDRNAPDFTALTVDGGKFSLSSVLGKKPVVLYFAAFDS
jgi:hypothetical protein